MSKRVRPHQGSSSMWTAVVVAVRTVSLCPCGPRPSVVVKHPLVVILILGYLCGLFYVRCQRVVLAVGKERER